MTAPRTRRPRLNIGLAAAGAAALVAFAASTFFYLQHSGVPSANDDDDEEDVEHATERRPPHARRSSLATNVKRRKRRKIFISTSSVDEVLALLPEDAAFDNDIYIALFCDPSVGQSGANTSGAVTSRANSRAPSRRGSNVGNANRLAVTAIPESPDEAGQDHSASRRSSIASRLSQSLTSLANAAANGTESPDHLLRSYMFSSAVTYPTERDRAERELLPLKGRLFTHILFHETKGGVIHLARHLGPDLVIFCRSMCPSNGSLRKAVGSRFGSTASLVGLRTESEPAASAPAPQFAVPGEPASASSGANSARKADDYDPVRDLARWTKKLVMLCRRRTPTGSSVVDGLDGAPRNVSFIKENAYEDAFESALSV